MHKFFDVILKRILVFAYDVAMVPIAWYLAYWLRYNLQTIPHDNLMIATQVLPLILILQMGCYWLFGLYRGVWRFASLPDLFRILKAVVLAILLVALSLFLYNRMEGIPRSVLLIYAVLLMLFLGGSRAFYRWIKDYSGLFFTGKRVLIIGAGREAEALVRSFRQESQGQYRAVAFLDDDKNIIGREIQGVRVVGEYKEFAAVLKKYGIDFVVIAAPQASVSIVREIVDICNEQQMEYRVLPTLSQITSGQVSIAELREVALEDLLGRDPVQSDWDNISDTIAAQKVLVTGGGGSIGSELCRQIAKLHPATLVIIENSEFNLYSIELELTEKFPALVLHTYLTDVTDRETVEQIFKQEKPGLIFHAAAYKHVPLLEHHIDAAVHNNILGTSVIAHAALAHHVKKFILISTDKAVNPTNVMGASKRVAEMLCQHLAKQHVTQFITVRFGNVLGSRGSVIPLFKKQLQQGGPITVTHPEIERFFMTIPEASQLILQAAILGKGSEVFVLDMGKPIKIRYLAEQMIKLAGKKLGEDIEIVYTGLRPGEKLYEELFYANEPQIPTAHQKIFQSQVAPVVEDKFERQYEALIKACAKSNQTALKELLVEIVPEYQASN